MFLHPHPSSSSPTAEALIIIPLHFDKPQARDGLNNLSGRLKDLIRPPKVAGIVVSDNFINGLGKP
jgi:hypothetical protein